MAETQSKRERDETQVVLEDTKRHKSYNQILSFLDDEDDEPIQDLSEIFTTFQQQLISDFPDLDPLLDPTQQTQTICQDFSAISAASDSSPSSSGLLKEEEEEGSTSDKEKVIRHLLEASDDELGIPNRMDGGDLDGEVKMNGGDNSFALCDGLWEIEDEAANYYTLLQSELFM